VTASVTIITDVETTRNAFCTLAEANAFIGTVYGRAADTWRAIASGEAGDDTKRRLIITATRDISRLDLELLGSKYDSTYAQAFPRSGGPEEDIPQAVKDATCYQALFHLSGRAGDLEAQADGVSSSSVGGMSVAYRGGTVLVCREALDALAAWTFSCAEVV
jgi:hypothetical protein